MRPIIIDNLNMGGISDSEFSGREGSASEIVGIDLHSEPGLMKVHQKLTKVTASNVADEFCKHRIVSSNGRIYWFSSTSGKVWEDNSGTWTLKYTTSAQNGASSTLGACEYNGFIYWATQNFIHRIKVSNASSTWNASTVESNWADLSLDQELTRKLSIACRFDGVDDYISIAAAALNHTDSVTFRCLFYAEKDSSDVNKYKIWGANDTASCLQVELGGSTTSNPNRNRIAIYSGSTLVAETANNVFEAGNWYHLVYTRNGAGAGNHKIYINGVNRPLVTDAATSFANVNTARFIGSKDSTPSELFPGLLAKIRIQTTVLSAAAVLNDYENDAYDITNTIAFYPLNNTKDALTGTFTTTLSGNPTFYYVPDTDLPFRTNLSNALSELDTNKKFFKANSETITYIKLWIVEKGSGNVTITIHDSSDTLVGSAVTVNNASLVNGWNYFTMSISGLVFGATYHVHVHASNTTVYLLSNNYNDVSDSKMQLLSNGDSEFHPMIIQNLVLFIGDRNYIHQVDFDRIDGTHVFSERALDFVSPLRAKCLGKFNTDLLIGTIVDARIAKTQILRWNTWSESFSVSDEIPEQGINAFIDGDNYVMANAGEAGNIYFYNGERLELMRTIKGNFDSGGKVTVHPEATANFKGLPLFGLSNVSGNPVSQGIYSFGSRNKDYPFILCLDFPISERSGDDFVLTGIEIGAITIVGNDLYVSWKNGVTSGIDKLDYSNKLDGAYVVTRIMDLTKVYLDNYKQYIAKYTSLPSGTDITMEYKKNYDTSFTSLNTVTADEIKQKKSELTITAAPIQLKFGFSCNVNDAPKVTDFIILAD